VISPRRTSLIRVPDLAAFRSTLTDSILSLTPGAAADTFVIVPTRAAGEQLRRTVEERALKEAGDVFGWPLVGTRAELYDELATRLPSLPARLSAFEREVMLAGVGRDLADEGLDAPFQLRPALVAEILGLYEHIRRLGRSVEDFTRNLLLELEPEVDVDRGARQLLQQTVFLDAVFRGYESRMAGDDRLDEHALRARLIDAESPRPLQRVVVTVADRIADPDGLWPADFDLLTRLPGLGQLEIVTTESALAAGLLERLHAALPELDQIRSPHPPRPAPRLVVPPVESPADAEVFCFTYRDREEELGAIARFLRSGRHGVPLHRTAIVVQRPLPYVYLATIPVETLDTLRSSPSRSSGRRSRARRRQQRPHADGTAGARSIAALSVVGRRDPARCHRRLRCRAGGRTLSRRARTARGARVPLVGDGRTGDPRRASPTEGTAGGGRRPRRLTPARADDEEAAGDRADGDSSSNGCTRSIVPPREDDPTRARRLRVRAAVLDALSRRSAGRMRDTMPARRPTSSR
jgi:hypothetical protein